LNANKTNDYLRLSAWCLSHPIIFMIIFYVTFYVLSASLRTPIAAALGYQYYMHNCQIAITCTN